MKTRKLTLECLESRVPLAGDALASGWHNGALPTDVNADGIVSPVDALLVVNELGNMRALPAAAPDNQIYLDVDANGLLSPLDALLVTNALTPSWAAANDEVSPLDYESTFNLAVQAGPQNLLTTSDVGTLLKRTSQATSSDDAIIAVVDRTGRILGVRVEANVDAALQSDPARLAFAIDGAVAKARTAAFFSSNAAPLTSRTIRFISQSTITQREVQSWPQDAQPEYQGPGFVAPIGTGGHFPPEIRFTPQVDLFGIEHQSRDSQVHPGADGIKSPLGPAASDDFQLVTRFNADPDFITSNSAAFFGTWPESYGYQAQTDPAAQARGIATLPGGVPLFKKVTTTDGLPIPGVPLNLVGGVGVFFPGEDGFATHEQDFVHASDRGGVPQSETARTNAPLVLEGEFMAFIAAAGGGMVGPSAFTRDLAEFNDGLSPLPDFVLPTGRIDLVGITLEIYGPTPTPTYPIPGIDRLLAVGRQSGGPTVASGGNVDVLPGVPLLAGQAVPEGWLVAPHDATEGDLKAADVERMIVQGVDQAKLTRAAIRLTDDFLPGSRTRMVLSVADQAGNLLGVFRMPDATVFSIDVSIAKARNTAYYADAEDLQRPDIVDFNGDGILGSVSQNLNVFGDTVPKGTALTNRTFRFLSEPRYPTGSELGANDDQGLVNDPHLGLCDQRPEVCAKVGPQSILRLPGMNPLTAENLVNLAPLSVDVYANPTILSTLSFDAFNVSRNFRDPGDSSVVIYGSDDGSGQPIKEPLANQNGVVFFPGSSAVYVAGQLAGGFGVSGDGVDQDDVVTVGGFVGYEPPATLRVDQYVVGFVRLPFAKFNRNPRGQ